MLTKRSRPRFEEVQASALQAVEDVEKNNNVGGLQRSGIADLCNDAEREVSRMIPRVSPGNKFF